jgi:signal transduction histidine kinase
MYRSPVICIAALLAGILPVIATPGKPAVESLSLTELEHRLADIDSKLKQLASYTLRGGTGSRGYRSKLHSQPDATEWIRIELGETVPIDQIVLVPTLWRDSETGIRSEGFPTAFRILAGTDQTTNIVASFSEEDNLLPRIAPLIVPLKQPVKASWVTIDATTLSPNIGKEKYTLQFSEVLVFSGKENVALERPVTTPLPERAGRAEQATFLTDGFLPYLMDAAYGLRSHTELMHAHIQHLPPTLTIDLTTPQPVNQINLHTAGAALSIPMIQFDCWAVPRHVRVIGATLADFTDQIVLCEYKQETIYDNGPIIMRRFPETVCRYIRIEILDYLPIVSLKNDPTDIAFSEIEVLSNSRNVAQGAPVTTGPGLSGAPATLAKITDGLNYYGEILPLREWMNQLARRHDLETERPLIKTELDHRYEQQKTNLRRVSWLAALLAAGTIITGLIGQIIRQRAVFRTRERIAANLHDELGANLHAIGLLGDLAQEEIDATGTRDELAELVEIVGEIRTVTEKTGAAARYCTNMLETPGLYENLTKEMQQTANHLLADLEHNVVIENHTEIDALGRRAAIDLYLFYKECLTNIIRHSGATRVFTRLNVAQKVIQLTVIDNGCGTGNNIPPSLKRRARFLRAKLHANPAVGGGTEITLQFRNRQCFARIQRQKSRPPTCDIQTVDQ